MRTAFELNKLEPSENTPDEELFPKTPSFDSVPVQTDRLDIGYSFSVVDVETDKDNMRLKEDIHCEDFVGDTNSIVKYICIMENVYNLTMPIKACGIDPIAFREGTIYVNDEGKSYEVITIDGEYYFSCTSSTLDPVFLNSVVNSVMSQLFQNNKAELPLVSHRISSDIVLKTMTLNSYELSFLISQVKPYTSKIEQKSEGGASLVFYRGN